LLFGLRAAAPSAAGPLAASANESDATPAPANPKNSRRDEFDAIIFPPRRGFVTSGSLQRQKQAATRAESQVLRVRSSNFSLPLSFLFHLVVVDISFKTQKQ
jgi:hypothetical protein